MKIRSREIRIMRKTSVGARSGQLNGDAAADKVPAGMTSLARATPMRI
jgi:hypothetical protein